MIDFIFGYDFFVSYSWKDARKYAVGLAKGLKKRGFECFLDSSDFEKGTNWRLGARRTLRKTARLLLVCSPAALESQVVLDEIRTFLRTKRRIVPIHLTAESTAEGFKPFPELLSPDLLWIKEYPEALGTGPSKEVLEEIQQTFRLQRQQQQRVHWLACAAAAFAVIAVVAVVIGILAELRRRVALSRALAAEAVISKAMVNSISPYCWLDGPRRSGQPARVEMLCCEPAGSPQLSRSILKLLRSASSSGKPEFPLQPNPFPPSGN